LLTTAELAAFGISLAHVSDDDRDDEEATIDDEEMADDE
jgi:hypothetical protein